MWLWLAMWLIMSAVLFTLMGPPTALQIHSLVPVKVEIIWRTYYQVCHGATCKGSSSQSLGHFSVWSHCQCHQQLWNWKSVTMTQNIWSLLVIKLKISAFLFILRGPPTLSQIFNWNPVAERWDKPLIGRVMDSSYQAHIGLHLKLLSTFAKWSLFLSTFLKKVLFSSCYI